MDSNLKQQIFSKIDNEVNTWGDATVFVTDRVAFHMRNLIKQLRKNYWGIFDKPNDQNDANKKIWVPLTESLVDTVVKNIDLDTKDVNLRAKNPAAIPLTEVVRQELMNVLEQMDFGQLLDDLEQDIAIDGTAIWKTFEGKDRDGRPFPFVKKVDLLNGYLDPSAPCIQESVFIERTLMTPDEIARMDGWDDKEDLQFRTNMSRSDKWLNPGVGLGGTTQLRDVYERWGLIAKDWITGKESDKGEWINAHIVVSGLEAGDRRLHVFEENKRKDLTGTVISPYEECWYKRIPNRWYGKGIAEKVMWLQVWMNTVVNTRITRNRVAQLGLFKIRAQSGIDQNKLSRLAANGAIVVNNMDDIEQMIVQEATAGSYKDEEVASSWAQRVTSAFESVTGEQLPASTPATNAVISNRGAQSEFVKIKEGIGLFLQRWLTRHVLPIIQKRLKKGEIIRVTGDINSLVKIDEWVVNQIIYEAIDKMNQDGRIFDINSIVELRDKLIRQLQSKGDQRFYELVQDKVDLSEYDVKVYITNEEIDKSVLVQNLLQVFQTASAVPGSGISPMSVLEEIYNVMGLNVSQLRENTNKLDLMALINPPKQQLPAIPQGMPSIPQAPNPAQIQQEATTM